jgi:hypothetical protein
MGEYREREREREKNKEKNKSYFIHSAVIQLLSPIKKI